MYTKSLEVVIGPKVEREINFHSQAIDKQYHYTNLHNHAFIGEVFFFFNIIVKNVRLNVATPRVIMTCEDLRLNLLFLHWRGNDGNLSAV